MKEEERRPMRLQDEPDIPAQINIVPMIDVIFAILTFFIMSTLFLTRSEGLPVNLPKAATAQQQQVPSKITITVDEQGVVSLNKKPIAVDDITQQVRSLIGSNSEMLVIINADEKVSHGKVIAVMDRVREVPGAKLAVATQRR
jgi:biopolymer transport protein ExbD